MSEKRKPMLPPYVMLMLVAIVMSFAIAGVYAVTKDAIDAAALEAQIAARTSVMPEAAYMAELVPEEGAPVDYVYEAYDAAGNVIGYVGQITVVGFGGEIEVTVGMDMTGAITAISVGGPDFSETSGLGAKTREAAFTDQFSGVSGLLVLKQNIDSVTGASVSSGAVVSGVNKALAYMTAFLPEEPGAAEEELFLSDAQKAALGVTDAVWMGTAPGVDGWWRTEDGYLVRATGFGEGPIVVVMAFDPNGVVTGIVIGDENFMETEGRGALILEEYYWGQFVGRSGAQAYGYALDAISGATVTSDAALAAINACMSFDPVSGVSAAPVEETTGEPDAVTEASVPEEETTATAEPDAVTEATVPEEDTAPVVPPSPTPGVDAATEASIPEEEATAPAATVVPGVAPTFRWVSAPLPDAVTEASLVEESSPTPVPTPDAVTEASVTE